MATRGPQRRIRRLLCAAAALGLASAAPAAAGERAPRRPVPKPSVLQLDVESPAPGVVVGAQDGRFMVAGRALAAAARGGAFDVVVVIDTSSSTPAPSGADGSPLLFGAEQAPKDYQRAKGPTCRRTRA